MCLGLLLTLVNLALSHESTRLAELDACFVLPVLQTGQVGMWRNGRSVRQPAFHCVRQPATGLRAGRMQVGKKETRSAPSDGMNELERAREALAAIIAKRKGLTMGSSTSESQPNRVSSIANPETLGARMAATFPSSTSAKTAKPATPAKPATLVNPAKPMAAVRPVVAAMPATPAKPATLATPAKPAKPPPQTHQPPHTHRASALSSLPPSLPSPPVATAPAASALPSPSGLLEPRVGSGADDAELRSQVGPETSQAAGTGIPPTLFTPTTLGSGVDAAGLLSQVDPESSQAAGERGEPDPRSPRYGAPASEEDLSQERTHEEGRRRKGRRVVDVVPPVEWAIPEEQLSIVTGDESTVVQAKMNLKEFEAANSGWADGQDWAVDTNYAKGSDAPAAAQLGKRRRGKGAGAQALVQEIFRRAKFTGTTDVNTVTSSNWKDDWVGAFDNGDAATCAQEVEREGRVQASDSKDVVGEEVREEERVAVLGGKKSTIGRGGEGSVDGSDVDGEESGGVVHTQGGDGGVKMEEGQVMTKEKGPREMSDIPVMSEMEQVMQRKLKRERWKTQHSSNPVRSCVCV